MDTKTEILALIEQSQKRADAATEGPWRVCSNPDGQSQPLFPYVIDSSGLPDGGDIIAQPFGSSEAVKATSKFIAAARTDVPRLNEALRIAVEALQSISEMSAGQEPDPSSASEPALRRILAALKGDS